MPMRTERAHVAGDRYQFDFGLFSLANGFAQIDTRQDASYYGQWLNPFTLQAASFVEGDFTINTCDTPAEFTAHIRELAAWHASHDDRLLKIDPGSSEAISTRLTELGLGDLLH